MKIPEIFHNSLEDSPFTHCKMCDGELIENRQAYLIEKAFRRFPGSGGEELIFEIAICMDCATDMRTKLSKESLATVNKYFYNKAAERRQEMLKMTEDDLLNTCLFTGQGLDQMEEYQIYAHCHGDQLSPMGGMYLLSGEVIEEIQEMLSAETRDELERFSNDHLGTPPELQKLFSRGDLITL